MIFKVNINIYFQNYSYSHSYGMKKRSAGSHKDPLVSSVVTHITVFCVVVKFTDPFREIKNYDCIGVLFRHY